MTNQRDDLISAYLSYIGETESPITFHRWSCLSIIGAWLGRRYSFQLGHFNIASNLYVMLMGGAGSRKSTAIKIAASLLRKAGYETIAAERTTKEKFLMDLAGEASEFDSAKTKEDILEENLFGPSSTSIAEILVAADEFNTFVGNGNIEFLSLLGVLWDYSGRFEDRKKNSKSLIITDPTVSILAGNTATGFSLAFPAEAIGQGIFSRLILVHGEKTDKRITFPEPPCKDTEKLIIDIFKAVRQVASGNAILSPSAQKLLDHIYKSWNGVTDVRFESYANRRFSHLIKLCLIVSAAALRNTIEEADVIYANTILTHAEHSMPKALGEFGKARNSDVAHKVIQLLESSYVPVTMKEIWRSVHNDLDDISKLKDMISNLVIAEKVISTKGGFLARRAILEEVSNDAVDFNLLTSEERKYVA
jgi:hypothetical protein